jgi:hypothetical protein
MAGSHISPAADESQRPATLTLVPEGDLARLHRPAEPRLRAGQARRLTRRPAGAQSAAIPAG